MEKNSQSFNLSFFLFQTRKRKNRTYRFSHFDKKQIRIRSTSYWVCIIAFKSSITSVFEKKLYISVICAFLFTKVTLKKRFLFTVTNYGPLVRLFIKVNSRSDWLRVILLRKWVILYWEKWVKRSHWFLRRYNCNNLAEYLQN